MPLSVLSALARLNVDPWKEAAELSELPTDAATQRLASLIARLPRGRWAQADSGAIADRLIELLPHRASSKVSLAEKAHGLREMTGSALAIMLICAALGVIVLIIAANREPSSRSHHARRAGLWHGVAAADPMTTTSIVLPRVWPAHSLRYAPTVKGSPGRHGRCRGSRVCLRQRCRRGRRQCRTSAAPRTRACHCLRPARPRRGRARNNRHGLNDA